MPNRDRPWSLVRVRSGQVGRRAQTPSRILLGWLTTLERTTEVRVGMTYHPADPYALTLDIHQTDGPGTLQWVFARELLFEGMSASRDHPAGLDRVRVWPDTVDGVQKLYIALISSTICLVELIRGDVLAFLVDTLQVVPAGSEPRFCDIDAELRRILA